MDPGKFSLMIAPTGPGNSRNSEGDIIALNDGTLLFAWSDFYGGFEDHAAARISARTSDDGGRTWSEKFTLQENTGQQNVMSVSFLRPASGDILFFYMVKNSDSDLDGYVRRSTDEARTWSDPVLITPEPGYYVMNNARVIQLRSGRILAPTSVTDGLSAIERFRNVIYYSDDDGRTWRRGTGIVDAPRRGAMEPGLVELTDGRVLQIIRTQMGSIWAAYSSDGGDTWTSGADFGVSAPEAPSTIVRFPTTGDLLLIRNPFAHDGADHSGRRTPLVATVSHDDGLTWGPPREMESDLTRTFAYVSVTFVGDEALLTYYVEADGTWSTRLTGVPISWFYGD